MKEYNYWSEKLQRDATSTQERQDERREHTAGHLGLSSHKTKKEKRMLISKETLQDCGTSSSETVYAL